MKRPLKPTRTKRRLLFELLGFTVLAAIVAFEWNLIKNSLRAIGDSNTSVLIIAFAVYWALPLLTTVSYRLLGDKRIKLLSVTLSHLAGAGPGRVIPGGLGHVSLVVIHLSKLGLKTQQAIAISLASNFAGIIINLFVLTIAILYKPAVHRAIASSVSSSSLILLGLTVIGIIALCAWLMQLRSIRQAVKKVMRQFWSLLKLLGAKPIRLLSVLLVSLLILLGNIVILWLSAKALHIHINYTDAIVALSFGALIGGLLPTPGGLGAVEAGTVASLVALGYSPQDALSIALLYRVITYWQPLLPGVAAYLYLRERKLL